MLKWSVLKEDNKNGANDSYILVVFDGRLNAKPLKVKHYWLMKVFLAATIGYMDRRKTHELS